MLSEPWAGFLDAFDAALTEETTLHCMGGFAVALAYGLERPTADIDVLAVAPEGASLVVRAVAGKGSALQARFGVYVDVVGVATVPSDYVSRLAPLFPGRWRWLRLLVLEAHDLALSKLERNAERDRGDVAYLAGAGLLDAAVLRQRV